MGANVIQASFTGGELSPSAYGRVDLARYLTSLRTCRNFIVRPYGGVVNRPGTRLIVETKDSSKVSRLVPFQFSSTQTYVLEFGDYYMRVVREGVQITDAGTPVEVATPWPVSVLSELKFSQKADILTVTHPDYPTRTIGRLSHTDWNLSLFEPTEGPFQDVNTDLVVTVYASAEEGAVNLVSAADVFTPSLEGTLFRLEAASFAGIERWEPGKEIAAAGVNPYGKIRAYHGRLYKCVTDAAPVAGIFRTGSNPPTHLEGTESDGDGAPVQGFAPDIKREGVEWEYVSDLYGIVLIDVVTDARNASGTVVRRLPLALVGGGSSPELVTNGTFPADIAGWTDYSVGGGAASIAWDASGALALLGDTVSEFGPYSSIAGQQLTSKLSRRYRACLDLSGATAGNPVIVRVGSALHDDDLYTASFTSDGTHLFFFEAGGVETFIEFESTGTVLVDNVSVKIAAGYTPTYKWAKAAWSADQGYPGTSAYHQQRQIFAAARQAPSRFWMSRGGAAYTNFGQGVPILDDDAIVFAMDSTMVNEIRHLVPGGSGFLALTSGGIWQIRGTQDGALTPTSIYPTLQEATPCSHIPPLTVGSSILFIHDKGSVVADLAYALARDGYQGRDLTVMSSHLFFKREVTDWAFQKVPFSTAWAVRDDGVLLGLTYLPEQEVFGWHRHDTDGVFESVACVSEGSADALYAVVRRVIGSAVKRFIERFDSRMYARERDAYFVDCGLSFDAWNATGTTVTLSGGTTWEYPEALTATASADVFTAGMVGTARLFLEVGGVTRRFDITGFTSASVATVRPTEAIPAAFRGVALTDWAIAYRTFSGLDHLIGKTVSILADGNVEPQAVVSAGGSITLQNHAAVVHAGLPYVSDLETLDLVVPGEQLRGRTILVPRVSLIVEASRGIWVGQTPLTLMEYKQRDEEGYDDPVSPATGLIGPISIPATWSKGGRVFLRQVDPLPLSVLAVIPDVVTGG